MADTEFPWESGYQYRCRVDKIAQYTPSLGPLRAVALANVWANHHFLGCSYPAGVLAAIKHWEAPPKNKCYEEKLAEVQQSEQDALFDPDLVNPHLSLKLLKLKLYRGTGEVEEPAVCMIYNSSQKSRLTCEFVEVTAQTKGSHRVALYVNNIHVSDGEDKSFKEAKHACADNALKYLKKKGLTVIVPAEIDEDAVSQVSKNSLGTRGTDDLQKIDDDNVGSKMLKMMGWTGDTGLGKDGQGILDPVSSLGQTNRGGLGSHNSEFGICRQTVQEQLLSFMRDNSIMKLEFSNELDNLERKLIHNLSEKYGLKHKSKGSGANRRLMVWKEEESSVADIMAEPVIQFEENEEQVEDGPGFVDEQWDTSQHMNTLAIQPDQRGGALAQGERDSVAMGHGSGKRRIKTAGNLPKVSKNNVPLEYKGFDSRTNRQDNKRAGKKQDRTTVTRTAHFKEEQGRGQQQKQGQQGRGQQQGQGEQKQGHQGQKQQQPKLFREGYIDPFVTNPGPPRDPRRRGDTFNSCSPRDQNTASRTPCPYTQQPNGFDESYLRGPDPRIHVHQSNGFDEPNQRNMNRDPRNRDPRNRDPRTNHSSGFGIYRDMRGSNNNNR